MDKRPFRLSTVVSITAIALFFGALANAQEFPAFRFVPPTVSDQSMDLNSFLRWDWVRNFGVGRAAVGIFYGGGSLRVTHTIEPGPNFVAAIPGIPDFDTFTHTRETPLRDGYFQFELGLASQGFELIQFRYQTNFARPNQYAQWTDAGLNTFFERRFAVGAVLGLPNNQEGIIYLDNRNRIWACDLTGRIPGFWGVDFLFEYKWMVIRSDLEPYSRSYDPLERSVLYPNVGWVNNFRNAVPFTTGFTMSQNFKWHGPFIGLSLRTPFLGWLGGGHLEFVGSPWLFGRYEFDWAGAYEDGFFFVRGSQTTRVEGWDRIGLEVRGGISCPLFGRALLDVRGKYTYIRLRDSNIELQAMQNNFLATPQYVQGAPEYVTANQQFWQVGCDLNFPF